MSDCMCGATDCPLCYPGCLAPITCGVCGGGTISAAFESDYFVCANCGCYICEECGNAGKLYCANCGEPEKGAKRNDALLPG